MKVVKWVLWIVVALIIVVVGAIAFIAMTVDPNEYKPDLIKMVKDHTGRTLTISGEIELKFYPKIGPAVQGVTLSAPNSDQRFAQVDEARVALALLPLLSKQFIVDEVTLTGLEADLVKYKDGSTNFDDLLGEKAEEPTKPKEAKPSKSAKMPAIDIGGIALRSATVGWQDQTNGTQLRASDVNLNTGRIASGVPGKVDFSARVDGTQPKLALQINLQAGYRFDIEKGSGQLSNMDLKADGDAATLNALQLRIKGDTAGFDPKAGRIDLTGIEATAKSGDMLDAHFTVPKLLISPDRSESKPIAIDLKYKTPERAIEAHVALSALNAAGRQIQFASADIDLQLKQDTLAVAGKIGSPVLLDLDTKRLQLATLVGDFSFSGPKVPNKSAKLHLEGSKQLDWGQETAQADLRARLEDGTVNARVAVKGFDTPAVKFDVNADRLNIDQYLPPADKTPASADSSAGAKGGGVASSPATKESPIDLGWLKTLQAQGSVKVGELVVSNIKAQNVTIGVDAGKGRLSVDPIRANLYRGSVQGSAIVNAHRNSYVVKQRLVGVNIGPLLRDVADKDLLEGRGNVELDLHTVGTTPDALKRALDGTASVVLKDGAVKGFNLAEALRKAKAVLGSKSAAEEQAKGGEQTDFSDMSASFKVQSGIAHNNDLLLRSPFLRVNGSGDVNIPDSNLDYLVKASLVNTSTGQGGKGLDKVGSVTVPVTITGPMDNLKYRLDTRALIEDKAKDELRRQLERRLGGKQDAQQGEAGAPAGKDDKRDSSVGEQLLRGLIKK